MKKQECKSFQTEQDLYECKSTEGSLYIVHDWTGVTMLSAPYGIRDERPFADLASALKSVGVGVDGIVSAKPPACLPSYFVATADAGVP